MNPPLVRLVAALPSTIVGYTADWSGFYEHVGTRPEFDMGEDVVAANGRQSMLHFRLARWACIPFSLLGAWICFAWARDLFGHAAGIFAVSLWCFSPMVLGHASMIAPDAHATSLGLAACDMRSELIRHGNNLKCGRDTVFATFNRLSGNRRLFLMLVSMWLVLNAILWFGPTVWEEDAHQKLSDWRLEQDAACYETHLVDGAGDSSFAANG